MTNGFAIIASCPKGWYSGFEFWKFIPQFKRRISFELINNVNWGINSSCLYKNMQMIWHNFHVFNNPSMFVGFFQKKFFKPDLNVSNKNFSPIFRTPYNVVSAVVNSMFRRFPSRIHKIFSYTLDKYIILFVYLQYESNNFVQTIKYKIYKSAKNKRIHQMINTSAWIWNHCVALQKRYYRLYKKYINVNRLQKHVAKIRNKNAKWKQLPSQSVQEICQRLDASYSRFFKKTSKRPPKFKKACNFSSFVLKQSGWKIIENKIIISKTGTFKFSKSRGYENIKRISVKRDRLGNIFICLQCDMKQKTYKREGNSSIGMDFGLKTYLTLSDGSEIQSPQFFKAHQNNVKKANQRLSSKQNGSNNRKKAKTNLAKIHSDISNKRSDFHWKLAHQLCKQNKFIAIEDLNINAMKRLWGKKVSDLSFSEFVSRLEQVALKYGTTIQKIGRFYPSSKMCDCGTINKELKLSDRKWVCTSCGSINHRDKNASQNILSEGIRLCRTNSKPSVKRSKLGLKAESHVLQP